MHFCFLKWDYQLGVWGWGVYVMKFGFICPERVKHMANFISFDP